MGGGGGRRDQEREIEGAERLGGRAEIRASGDPASGDPASGDPAKRRSGKKEIRRGWGGRAVM